MYSTWWALPVDYGILPWVTVSYCILPCIFTPCENVHMVSGKYSSLSWRASRALHQQNVFYSLEASKRVWEDVECKLRCINRRRVWDPRRAFLPAFRVNGSTGDKVGSPIDKPGSTCECRRQTWERLEVRHGRCGSNGGLPRLKANCQNSWQSSATHTRLVYIDVWALMAQPLVCIREVMVYRVDRIFKNI